MLVWRPVGCRAAAFSLGAGRGQMTLGEAKWRGRGQKVDAECKPSERSDWFGTGKRKTGKLLACCFGRGEGERRKGSRARSVKLRRESQNFLLHQKNCCLLEPSRAGQNGKRVYIVREVRFETQGSLVRREQFYSLSRLSSRSSPFRFLPRSWLRTRFRERLIRVGWARRDARKCSPHSRFSNLHRVRVKHLTHACESMVRENIDSDKAG